jgi:hypothetical protein
LVGHHCTRCAGDASVVGTTGVRILALTYRGTDGALLMRALVDDAVAMRCPGLSISTRVKSYRIHDQDRPGYWAAVDVAELVEISLTPRPLC